MPTRSGKAYKAPEIGVASLEETTSVVASASSANKPEENSAGPFSTFSTTTSTTTTPASLPSALGWDEPIPTLSSLGSTPSPREKRRRDIDDDGDEEEKLDHAAALSAARRGKRVCVSRDGSPQRAVPAIPSSSSATTTTTSNNTNTNTAYRCPHRPALLPLKPRVKLQSGRVADWRRPLPPGRTKKARLLAGFFPERLVDHAPAKKPAAQPESPRSTAAAPTGNPSPSAEPISPASVLVDLNRDQFRQNRATEQRRQRRRRQRQSPSGSPSASGSSSSSPIFRRNNNDRGSLRRAINDRANQRVRGAALFQLQQLQRRPGFLRRIVQAGHHAVRSGITTTWNSFRAYLRARLPHANDLQEHQWHQHQQPQHQQTEQQRPRYQQRQQEPEPEPEPELESHQGAGGRYYLPDFPESSSSQGSSQTLHHSGRLPRTQLSPSAQQQQQWRSPIMESPSARRMNGQHVAQGVNGRYYLPEFSDTDTDSDSDSDNSNKSFFGIGPAAT